MRHRPPTEDMGRRTPKRIKRFLQRYDQCAPLHAALCDPRKRRGVRWAFDTIVDTLMLGMLLMCKSLRDVEAKSERAGKRVPDSTLAYTLERIDPTPFDKLMHDQVRQQHRSKAYRSRDLPIGVCAVDGKTVWVGDHLADPACQRQDNLAGASWQLRVIRAVLTSAPSRPCIHQQVTPADTNDMGGFEAFFQTLIATYARSELFECVTCDAGFTSKHNAGLIDDAGKAYVLGVKGNQPTLHGEMKRLLAQSTSKPDAATDWERAHGTQIRRELFRTAEIAGFDDWPHLRQAWLVRQTTRRRHGTETVEDRYFATNLTSNRLTPKQILRLVRLHWAIENDCFHTLDVVWKEDTTAWATNAKSIEGRLPLRVLMGMRMLAYNLLTWMVRVHLRGDRARTIRWDDLRAALFDVLLATPSPLAQEVALVTT